MSEPIFKIDQRFIYICGTTQLGDNDSAAIYHVRTALVEIDLKDFVMIRHWKIVLYNRNKDPNRRQSIIDSILEKSINLADGSHIGQHTVNNHHMLSKPNRHRFLQLMTKNGSYVSTIYDVEDLLEPETKNDRYWKKTVMLSIW